MARFIAATQDNVINVDQISYLFVRPDGDCDIHLVGTDKTITLRGNDAMRFQVKLMIEK